MPRKSAAELAMLPYVDEGSSPVRPRHGVPKAVREIFLSLVASAPSDHFREGDADLIEQYAQAIALARRAYDELERGGPVIEGKASPWIVILEKANRASVALAARLRLAPQQRLDQKAAGRAIGSLTDDYDHYGNPIRR